MNFVMSEKKIYPEPGIYHDIPWSRYCAWNAFSQSLVPFALKSKKKLLGRIAMQHRSTRSMALGSLVDCLVLEPHEFENSYVMQPKKYKSEKTIGRGNDKKTVVVEKPWNSNSNTCKEFLNEAAAQKKTVIDADTYSKAVEMKAVIEKNEEARTIIESSEKQVSIVWRDDNTGILCKGRLDLVGKKITDLKTTVDASKNEFARSIAKWGYHVQAGAYVNGYHLATGDRLDYAFIAVESGRDPECQVYDLDPSSVIKGYQEFCNALIAVKSYDDGDDMGMYTPFSEPISVPEWRTVIGQNNEEMPW